MTGRSEKGRAIFLAALMVLSMVAVPLSFAGGAAAQATNANIDLSNIEGESFEQGDTVEDLTTEIEFGTGYDTSKNYTVTINATDPSGEDVDIINESGFSTSDFVLELESGETFDVELRETDEDGVFYISSDQFDSEDGVIPGDLIEDTNGTATLDIAVDDDAELGTYNFTTNISEVDSVDNDGVASINSNLYAESAEFDIETNRAINADPETVLDNQTTVVDVSVDNHPDGVNADYSVEINENTVKDETTSSDGTFSFVADTEGNSISAGDSFDITINYDSGSVTSSVDVNPELNLTVERDVENPTIGDRVEFEGSFLDGDGDEPPYNLEVHSADNETIDADTRVENITAPSGIITSETISSLPDAGNYTFVANDTDGDQFFEIESGAFSAASEEGNLTFTTNETPRANDNTVTYNATLVDSDGEGVELQDDGATAEGEYAGYVAVTGNFSGDSLAEETGTIERVVVNGSTLEDPADVTADDTVTTIHGITDTDGVFEFNATAEEAGDITSSLQVIENTSEFELGDTPDGVGGVEDAGYLTTGTLDLVADEDAVTVEALGDLNVDVTTDPDPLTVNESSNEISVDVTGADNLEPGDGNEINTSNVTLTSDDYDLDEEVVLNESNTGGATFSDLQFDQAGTVTVSVEAYDDNGDLINSTSQSLDVDGDFLVGVTPEEVTAGDEETVSIELNEADGTPANDRVLNLTGSALDDPVEMDSGNLEDLGVYEKNVTFDSPGSVNLTVTSDDGTTTTVDATDVISVGGDEAYEFRTDEELLASATEDFTVEVYDLNSESIENDSDTLDELATNLELEQDGSQLSGFSASTDDVENGTIAVTDVEVTGTETINISSTFDNAFEGQGTIDAVEPTVETDLDGDSLTEGVTTEDIEITVTDPRDGSAVDNGTVQLTANGTDFNVSNTDISDSNTDTVDLDENGTAVINATPDAVSDPANTSLEIDAQVDGSTTDYFGQIDVAAGNLSLSERVDGEEVDVRDEIEFDSEENIVFVLRDANDDRIDERSVNVTGASVDNTEVTDEGFFNVDFADEDPDEGGTIAFNVVADGNFSDIEVATIDVTEDREEVELTASVANDTVTQGDDLEFEVVRGDFNTLTRANLSFVNESDETVDTFNTGDSEADDYGVVNTSDLEPGDYEVEVTKPDGSTKTFTADSLNVTVEEPPAANFTIELVDGPTEVVQGESYEAIVNVTNTGDLADTQNLTYELENESGDVVIEDTKEVELNASESTEETFEAVGNDTTDLLGNYTHVISTDDNELTIDVEFVEEASEPPVEASVDITDQNSTGDSVVVDEANASVDYVVVIHNESGDIVGSSDDINASESVEDLEVDLDTELNGSQNVTAMLHETANDSAYGSPIEIDGEVVQDTAFVTIEEVDGPEEPVVGDEPPQDLNGDGTFEDVDGDGELTVFDVQAFFSNRNSDTVDENVAAFDFDGDGEISIFDVQTLFSQIE